MIILYTYKPIPIKTKQNSFYFPYPELKENIGCQIKPCRIYQSRPCLGSLALARSLRTTSLHLLVREVAQITTGYRITTLSMPLLSSESELLVLLLAFGAGLVGVSAGTLATTSLVSVVNGDVEEVVGILGRAGGISLALCNHISLYSSTSLGEEGTHSS